MRAWRWVIERVWHCPHTAHRVAVFPTYQVYLDKFPHDACVSTTLGCVHLPHSKQAVICWEVLSLDWFSQCYFQSYLHSMKRNGKGELQWGTKQWETSFTLLVFRTFICSSFTVSLFFSRKPSHSYSTWWTKAYSQTLCPHGKRARLVHAAPEWWTSLRNVASTMLFGMCCVFTTQQKKYCSILYKLLVLHILPFPIHIVRYACTVCVPCLQNGGW